MKAYIIASLIVMSLGAFMSAGRMAQDQYPRKREYGLGYDTADLIIKLACIAWCAWLLWR